MLTSISLRRKLLNLAARLAPRLAPRPPLTFPCDVERILKLSMLVGSTISIVALSASAEFDYIVENGAVTITSYYGESNDVMVPSVIEGSPVTKIGAGAFSSSWSLSSVSIPEGVIEIADRAFEDSIWLRTVTMPQTLRRIGHRAFGSCMSLAPIDIPPAVQFIGERAFVDCSNARGEIVIPDSVTYLGPYAFDRVYNVSAFRLGSGLTRIEAGTFSGCGSLQSIDIPPGIGSIDDYAFSNCKSVTEVTGCASVTNIGGNAFYLCWNLQSLSLPPILKSIGDEAFTGCQVLRTFNVPRDVMYIGRVAFDECKEMTVFTVAAENRAFRAINGTLYSYDSEVLVKHPEARGGHVLVLPSVKRLAAGALSSGRISSVLLPSGLLDVGDGCFGSSGICNIVIPHSVTNIGRNAFSGCRYLTNLVLGNGLRRVGERAFSDCAFQNIAIPASVTHMGPFPFEFCMDLRGVYFAGDTPVFERGLTLDYPSPKAFTGYFLPSRSGWSSNFWATPFRPWDVRLASYPESPDIRMNRFTFEVLGSSNLVVAVEAASDPSTNRWTIIAKQTLDGRPWRFEDSNWSNSPARFYRLRTP